MTVVPTEGPAPWQQYGDVGLEDVDASDIKMPRLSIDHKNCAFTHSASNASLGSELHCIVLGVIKQRTFFPKITGKGSNNKPPFCRSNDFANGFPTDPYKSPKDGGFPWGASGFQQQGPDQEDPELGRIVLPCERCQLKEWRTKTFDDNGRPHCQVSHTYVLLFWDGSDWQPALLGIKGVGLKPSGSFLSLFATNKRPFFTANTVISLTPARSGDDDSADYAIPKFVPDMKSMTDQSQWDSYVAQLTSARDMVRQAPRPFEKDDDGNVVPPEVRTNESPEESFNSQQAAQGAAPAWAAYVQPDESTPTYSGTVIADTPTAPPVQAPPPQVTQPPQQPVAPPVQPPAQQPAPQQAPPPAAPQQPQAPEAEPIPQQAPPLQVQQQAAPPAPPQAPPAAQAPPQAAPSTPPPLPGTTSSGLPF